MKIKDGFIIREVAGNFIVVAVGSAVKQFNGVITLNETGSILWKKLQEGCEKQDLIEVILNEYEVSEDVAEKDVASFIEKLESAGLLK